MTDIKKFPAPSRNWNLTMPCKKRGAEVFLSEVEVIIRLSIPVPYIEPHLMCPSGVGKTHLAIALGYRATQAGIKIRFMTPADLLLILITVHMQNNLKRVMHRGNQGVSRGSSSMRSAICPWVGSRTNLFFQAIAALYEKEAV